MDIAANSRRLYDTLDQVGVSEVARRNSQNHVVKAEIIDTLNESLLTGTMLEIYCFGSFSEGTHVVSMKSDVDCVYCSTHDQVVTDTTEPKLFPSRFFVVRDQTTYPGYVKLQEFKNGTPSVIGNTEKKINLTPDKYGRMCFVYPPNPPFQRHGPALMINMCTLTDQNVKFEGMLAFKWRDFPNTYKQWYHRQRLNTMLTTKGLKFCYDLPLLLVHVGHPFSEERDIEWRVSYSLHERELMFSLNLTQHKCYVTLKMIKVDILEPVLGKDCISSYHLKTCLFWTIENTPKSMWTSDHLLQCICQCLWYLFYFVLKQNCPNYFLPEANLFQRYKFTDLYDSVVALLKRTITGLFKIIASIKRADVGVLFRGGYPSLRTKIEEPQPQVNSALFLISARMNWNITINSICCTCRSGETSALRINEVLNKLKTVIRCGEHNECITIKAKNVILPSVHLRLAVCLAAEVLTAQQGFKRQMLFCLAILNLAKSSGPDLTNPILILVTLLYKLGEFTECEKILTQIDADWKTHVLSTCSCYHPNTEATAFIIQQARSYKNQMGIMPTTSATCVSFMSSDRELVPEPLLLEMNRSDGKKRNPDDTVPDMHQDDWSSLDGKVYFYLMRYHVFSRLNKLAEKNECVQHIQTLIDTNLGLVHKDAAYNVLGWMYAQEGEPAKAIKCWKKSHDLKPHCNAAGRYLFDMLNSFLTLFTSTRSNDA